MAELLSLWHILHFYSQFYLSFYTFSIVVKRFTNTMLTVSGYYFKIKELNILFSFIVLRNIVKYEHHNNSYRNNKTLPKIYNYFENDLWGL